MITYFVDLLTNRLFQVHMDQINVSTFMDVPLKDGYTLGLVISEAAR
jgi:hypothetical protein